MSEKKEERTPLVRDENVTVNRRDLDLLLDYVKDDCPLDVWERVAKALAGESLALVCRD